MANEITRAGALFCIRDPDNKQEPEDWLAILPTDDPTLSSLIQALFDLCRDDEESLTDMTCLEEQINIKRPTIIRRCNWLIKHGLMIKTSRQLNDGRRTRTLYELTQPAKVEKITPEDHFTTSDLHTKQTRSNQLAKGTQGHLSFNNDLRESMSWKGEWLSIFGLIGALRIGKSGHGTEGHLEVPIVMGSEKLQLTLQSTAGMKFMSVLDLRVLLVIISIVVDHVENGEQVENPFKILVSDIVTALGKELAGGDKRYVVSALERIEGTRLKITGITNRLKDKYDGVLELDQVFRLINGMTILSHRDGNSKTPECLSISLNSSLWERLIDKDKRFLLLVHPDTLKEHRPLAIKFHLWCRRVIAHKDFMRNRPFELSALRTEISPLQKKKQFDKWFKEFYKSEFNPALDYAVYNGYCFQCTQWDVVTIWPEPNSIIHNGYHRVKKHEKIVALKKKKAMS